MTPPWSGRRRAWAMAVGVLVLVAIASVTAWILVQGGGTGRRAAPASAGAPAGASVAPVPALPAGPLPAPSDDGGVAGTVLRPDGLPATGARVTLHRAQTAWPEWRRQALEVAVTTAGGQFRFRTARGPDLLLEFEHPDFAGDLIEASPLVRDVQLRLQPGFVVSGFVVANRRRQFGCRVTLEPTMGEWRRTVGVDTGTDGAFRFDNVPAGSVRVVARHPAWQPAVQPQVTVGASRGLELRFERPPLSLTGRVLAGGSQRPLVGARVTALPNVTYRALFEPLVTMTGGDGRFTFQGLGPGNLRIEVTHPEWSSGSRSVAVSDSSVELLFELLPRAAVRGLLRRVDGVIGGALDGVLLSLRSASGEMGRCAVAVDGTFAFPGTWSLGNATLEAVDGAVAFARTSGADLPIRIEEGGEDLQIDVTAPSVLRGRVVDGGGAPLPGAQLLISQELLRLPAPDRVVAVALADGWFEVRGLAARSMSLTACHPGRAARRVEVQAPAPGATLTVPDVVLLPGGSIRGVVRRGEGPLPGALVQATGGVASGTTVAGADGAFLLTDLAPGSYRVRARYSTMPLAFAEGELTITPGAVLGPVELRFGAGRTVRGVVLGRDRQPVEGAAVTARGLTSSGAPIVTDAAGAFAIEVPQREVELLIATSHGGSQVLQRVPAEVTDVEVTLDVAPTATVTGRLLTTVGRRPLPAVLVRIEPIGGAGPRASLVRWLDLAGGALRLPFVPAQPCRLILQGEGLLPAVFPLTLVAGQEHDLGEVLLEPGAVLFGRVVDEQGAPVPGCTVFFGREEDLRDHAPPGRTDPQGLFRLGGVSSALPTLVAVAPGFAPRTVTLRLPQDVLAREPLPVVLSRGTRLEVAVHDGTAGQMVVLQRDGAILQVAESEDSGVAHFPNRAAGVYEVFLLGRPETLVQVALDGRAETLRLDL